MKKVNILPVLLAAIVLLSSCEMIGDIFKAGVYIGVFIVVIVIVLVLWLIRKIRR
jgi:hypothetical protein